ncbi:hypothetical protein [Pontiella sulfatireligans]|uniref:Uncharacterized protein n=1 Tax=Pontiella sulfatireligans TaxID=2750658 RepID=A0A6C2UUE6_9BACT|nr:hypothetical protein [Pontiella sulfatireligans]VGO22794.1 hypothetical protein SCARR_04891 [Pontiella sulfatireligans]
MKIVASILICCALASAAFADEAQAEAEADAVYFHPAASLYIHGDAAGASNLVATGLSIYPEDGKLRALEELLKKQQEQQDQENQNDQQQKNDDQQQQKNDEQQKQNQDQQKNDEQQQEQEQNPEQDQQNPEPEPEPQSAEQMTPDEAQRLLDAMRQEEENKRLQLHPVMGAPVKVDKDW